MSSSVVRVTLPITLAATRPCLSMTTVLGMEFGASVPWKASSVCPSGS